MTTAERINQTLQQLPSSFQQEVLDFVEFLVKKRNVEDAVTINGAVPGPENADTSEYAEKMRVIRSAMSDPLFLADLEEIREDFQYADSEGVIG